MKKVFSVIIAILMIIGLTGCSGLFDDNDSSSYRYEFIGELDMPVDYSSYLGYSVEIRGKLKNKSSREFSYVSVTFAIYDGNGNQIDTAMTNMNYLQAGNIWSFKASTFGWTDVEPKSCKLVEVTAW